MSIRENFQVQLDQVKEHIIVMGQAVEQALAEALKAFEDHDTEKMAFVIENDQKINQLELNINEVVTLTITKQQPVAKDLRKLIVALKMSSDLERIADLAVDIAKVGKHRGANANVLLQTYDQRLLELANEAKGMLSSVLQAYENSDMLAAQKIAAFDDKVDQDYGELIRSLFEEYSQQHSSKEVINLAFIGRYIERIADYATNLAEWIIYEVNGQHIDLN